MKKLLAILLAILLIISVVPLGAFTLDVSAAVSGYYTYEVIGNNAIIKYVDMFMRGDVTLPSTLGGYTVTGIRGNAFYCCSVKSVRIPDSVTYIGMGAFESCADLKSITIPDSVTSIGTDAFKYCWITNVYITDIASWCNIAFGNSVANPIKIAGKLYLNGELVTNLIIPDSVTSIGNYAFYNCNSLTSVTIPDSVTSIGDDAFSDCDSLTSVYYIGSEQDRANINIGSGNGYLTNATWYYNICDSDKHVYLNNCDSDCNVCDYSRVPSNHVYDDTCDTTCNECGYIREIFHTYTNNCDGECNICEFTRTPLDHIYSNNCDSDCNECGVFRVPSDHIYDNVCDVNCNECGILRVVPDHIYDNACDVSCNECGKIRAIPHIYDNDCDTTCNLCGVTRDITHTYSNNCDNECNVCGATRVPSDHIYDDTCDTTCNECDAIREITHTYSNNCDGECNVCGFTRVPSDHVYDDTCDTTCNECDAIREITHTYSNNCDSKCNICDATRVPSDHVYDNNCDTTCNECGSIRVTVHDFIFKSEKAFSIKNNSSYPFKESNGVYTSTNKSDNSTSSFVITALYDYELSLQYSVSSESNYDKLIIYKNSTALDTISGTITNKTKTISLKAGDTVKITYSKDSSQSSGNDCGSFTITSSEYVDTLVPTDTVEHLCDEAVICDVCGAIAIEATDHTYDNEYDYTCNVCKYSRAPHAPTLDNKYSGTIVLNAVDGLEYSIDGGANWQDSNVFVGLTENTEYSIVQRVKESGTAMQSEASDAFAVYLKSSQSAPAAPLALSFTDTMITLLPVSGCEYSLDGSNWQQSHVFRDLLPATQYEIYQRVSATETAEASNSVTVKVTTDKSVQGNVPPAPTMASHTASSITLNTVEDCEYSIDGKKWQSSAIFTGLSCGTEYTFYQRYKEDADSYAGKASVGAVIKTDKGTKQPPSAPTLAKKTHNSVTLVGYDGYEYSLDTVNWQTSPVFTDLNPSTNYVFFCRYAENDRYYASAASTYLTVRTNETPQCAIDGEHSYDNICDADCNYCGEMREDYHIYDNACDSDCNECGVIRTVGNHVYTNKCDPACNECGKERGVSPHVYTNSCDKDCNECGEIREVVDHVYDNACDATCDVCLATRIVPDHVYNNNCDVDCNECGAYRIPFEHIYNNNCDVDCNECGDTRDVPEHVFTSNCDISCDECGHIREAKPHTYSNDCDNVCNICGYERTVFNHVYDNNCDNTCNECGSVRTVSDHVYDTNCDADCNECYDTRIPSDHVYDNKCDKDCNECGKERVPDTHVYSNGCDNYCNECGFERIASAHVYDNDDDTTCNMCGAIRDITHDYSDWVIDKDPTCTVAGSKHKVCTVCGDTVAESIDATGVHNYVAVVTDPTCTEQGYTTYTCDMCGDNYVDDYVKENGHTFDNNCDTDCNVCGFTRDVSDHVYDDDFDAFCNECNAERDAKKHGDASGDGVLNNKDCSLLIQYINGWNVQIDIDSVDVNDDGKVNNKDYALLMRYLNGWDVVLK